MKGSQDFINNNINNNNKEEEEATTTRFKQEPFSWCYYLCLMLCDGIH